MDDIVVYGRPSLDERMISEELVPVERTEGDRVTGTTTNGTAPTETAAQGCNAAPASGTDDPPSRLNRAVSRAGRGAVRHADWH